MDDRTLIFCVHDAFPMLQWCCLDLLLHLGNHNSLNLFVSNTKQNKTQHFSLVLWCVACCREWQLWLWTAQAWASTAIQSKENKYLHNISHFPYILCCRERQHQSTKLDQWLVLQYESMRLNICMVFLICCIFFVAESENIKVTSSTSRQYYNNIKSKYCKCGYFRLGKISWKCWWDLSRGGNFLNKLLPL